MTKTRWIILAVVITAGFVLGRLAVRAVLDIVEPQILPVFKPQIISAFF